MIKLLVGLGNPGNQYQKTPHNVGFVFLEKYRQENSFPEWKFFKKFNAFISKKKKGEETIYLALPQTFMNNSGESVQKILSFYKIPSSKLIIVHDDIDIPLGSFKIQKNKGTAGHNGIKSIIEKIKTKDFQRIRIGINPKIKNGKSELKQKTEKFVLQNFTAKEIKILETIFQEISKSLS